MIARMRVAVIHGTKRKNNRSILAARYIAELGNGLKDVETVLIEPKDFPQVKDDGSGVKSSDYNQLVQEADAYIIVSPEYNHAYPGVLKTLLDSALKEYIHKPVVVAGVSNGRWGGVRAIESLVPVLRELGMIVSFADIMFPRIQDLFDEEGNMTMKEVDKIVLDSYQELLWLAETLKWGRDNLPNKHHQK